MDWTNLEENTIGDYRREADFKVSEHYATEFLDVSETISELSYLTHDFFRYYGKFPSKIAKYILEELTARQVIRPDLDFVFDHYNGSGTTMVEAKIAGYQSAGIDINPFGVLASNVKTWNYDEGQLKVRWEALLERIETAAGAEGQETLFAGQRLSQAERRGIEEVRRRIYLEFPDVVKWFEPETIRQLALIKYFLLALPRDEYRSFFALGFFAVLRRVSRAYDAEVRPHVNPKKRRRDPVAAYAKKISEMIATMGAWNQVTSPRVQSQSVVCDNRDGEEIARLMRGWRARYGRQLGLVVSHPPYLNCFDYIPVYKLAFLWAVGFDEIYSPLSYRQIRAAEIRSYPAGTDRMVNRYFAHNLAAYRIVFDQLRPGGCCCVVIGDCTIQKELFSVHKMLLRGLEHIGFEVERVTYRSTAYGMGRYAYRHRADYSEGEDGKQDAILFLRKPVGAAGPEA